MSEAPGEPGVVEAFWADARVHARLNTVPSYFGPTTLEVVTPPTWSFAEDPAEADAALAALLDGSATTLETPLADLEAVGEAPPQPGTLGIVLDGTGRPRALVSTTRVEVAGGLVVEHLAVLHRA